MMPLRGYTIPRSAFLFTAFALSLFVLCAAAGESPVLDLDNDTFYAAIQTHNHTVVHFDAPSFAESRVDWRAVAEGVGASVQVARVDGVANPKLCLALRVTQMPSVRIFWSNGNSRKYTGPPTALGLLEYVKILKTPAVRELATEEDKAAFSAQFAPRVVAFIKNDTSSASQAFRGAAHMMAGEDVEFAVVRSANLTAGFSMPATPPALRFLTLHAKPAPFKKKFFKEHIVEFVRANMDGRLMELDPDSIPYGIGYETPVVMCFLSPGTAVKHVTLLSNLAEHFMDAWDVEFAYTSSDAMRQHFALAKSSLPVLTVIRHGRTAFVPFDMSEGLALHRAVDWVESLFKSLIAEVSPVATAESAQEISYDMREYGAAGIYRVGGNFIPGESGHIRDVMHEHGMTQTVNPSSQSWNFLWTTYTRHQMYPGLRRGHKVNHIPNVWQMGRKDSLYKNYKALLDRFGEEHFNYHVETFIMPKDYEEFIETYLEEQGKSLWILKPAALSRGRGITIMQSVDDIEKESEYIAQRYVPNPYLLNRGQKGTLRVYVLITSVDPLRVYTHPLGFTRLCSEKYTTNAKDLANPYIHLTNIDVNKFNEDYDVGTEADGERRPNRWTTRAFFEDMRARGGNDTQIWADIQDMIAKTVISTESLLRSGKATHVPFRNSGFELLGFDFLVDDNYKPWIVEVNVVPALQKYANDTMDSNVKRTMLKDMLHLIGIIRDVPANPSQSELVAEGERLVATLDGMTLCAKGYDRAARRNRVTGEYTIDCLTLEEVEIVRETADEYQHRGGFERIVPAGDKYLQYYTSPSPNELLLANLDVY